MIYYNITQALRGFRRHKLFTLLNLVGFSIGLSACMVLAVYIYQERSMNRCYPDYQRIFGVEDIGNRSASMDGELVEPLRANYPDIALVAPIDYMDWPTYVYSPQQQASVQIRYIASTTNAFFTMFSVPVLEGDTQSPFATPNSIVVTRSLAMQLFGNTHVVGQEVELWTGTKSMVSAVVEDLPKSSSLRVQLFLNYEKEKFCMACNEGMCCHPVSIYLQLATGVIPAQLTHMLNTTFPTNKSRTDTVQLVPLANMYLSQGGTHMQFGSVGNVMLMRIYLGIAVAILLLSVVNYINFALARQLAMRKHAGVRRVVGAQLGHLLNLYLVEVVVMVMVSTLLALMFTALCLPIASGILGTVLYLHTLLTPQLLIMLLIGLVILIFLASFIPLLIIARLDINGLFERGHPQQSKQHMTTMLTIGQMVVSIILLSSILIINRQLNFVKDANMGFDKERLVALRSASWNKPNLPELKRLVDQQPFVINSSCSNGIPGVVGLYTGLGAKDEQGEPLDIIVDNLLVDTNFLATFRVNLIQGRSFAPTDRNTAVCYLNQEGFKQTGWHSIEGKHMNNFVEGGIEMIGIIGDFNTQSLHRQQSPICLVYSDNTAPYNFFRTLTVRLAPGNTAEQMAELERLWRQTLPTEPFDYVFYDDLFDSFYRKEQRQAQAITLFSIIALVITCMGLLGQVFQAAMARVREIGIRKVNGATRLSVMMLFGRSLLLRVGVALVLAVPVAYYAMCRWLQTFAYKVPLSWWIFALAGLVTLLVAGITVGWISWRAANINPTEALKAN